MSYHLHRLKKISKRKILFSIAAILVIGYVIFSSRLKYDAGDVFFGGVPRLYNVTLAHAFFDMAAYPLFGKAAPYAHHQLSRTDFIQGDLDNAIAEAKKEIEIYPDHLATYYIIGLTYGYMDQTQEAIDAFSKYIAYNPGTWAARNDKAWLQFRIGDIDGALTTIAPVASSTNNPWVQNTYGTLLLNKKRYIEARTAFENAWNVANIMTEAAWGRAYPGNDPRIYGTGLAAMKTSIQNNLKLLDGK